MARLSTSLHPQMASWRSAVKGDDARERPRAAVKGNPALIDKVVPRTETLMTMPASGDRMPAARPSHRVERRGEAWAGNGSMTKSYRIGLADDEATVRESMGSMLETLGHQLTFGVDSGRELVRRCQTDRPDLIISDIQMPDMDGLEAAAQLYQVCPTPVILVTGYAGRDSIHRAEEYHVLAYLVKPVRLQELDAAITLAVRRFEEFRSVQAEAENLRKALSDRKTIERAKGIIMKHLQVEEAEAFRRLQKLASSKNQKLVEVAEMILTAAQALNF